MINKNKNRKIKRYIQIKIFDLTTHAFDWLCLMNQIFI